MRMVLSENCRLRCTVSAPSWNLGWHLQLPSWMRPGPIECSSMPRVGLQFSHNGLS